MRQHSGQTTTEYILLAAIIGIASIAILSSFSNNFAAGLPSLLDRIFWGGGTGVSNTSSTNSTSMATSPLGTKNLTITTANGTVINLNNYPTDIKTLIEPTGGSGTSRLLMNQFQQLIQNLVAAGDINTNQAILLNDLANKGHRIANIANALETAANDPTFDLANDILTFEGSSMTARKLSGDLSGGFIGGNSVTTLPPDALTNPPKTCDSNGCSIKYILSDNDVVKLYDPSTSYNNLPAGGPLYSFIDTYQAAQASGALNDPVVAQLVNAMGADALSISYLYGKSASLNIAYAQDTSRSTPTMTLDNYYVSPNVNFDSSTICSSGGGTSSNTGFGITCN